MPGESYESIFKKVFKSEMNKRKACKSIDANDSYYKNTVFQGCNVKKTKQYLRGVVSGLL